MAVTQLNLMPIRKVLAGGVAGILSFGVIWGVRKWGGIELDADTAALIVTGIVTLVGYVVPPEVRDAVIKIDGKIKEVSGNVQEPSTADLNRAELERVKR